MLRGAKRRARTSPAGRTEPAHGFTLLELVIVMAILALVVTTVSFRFSSGSQGVAFRSLTEDLAAALRRTRMHALTENQDALFVIDLEERTFGAVGDPAPQDLPAHLSAEVTSAREEIVRSGKAGIRFFADGSSTGGRINLTQAKLNAEIRVDWLTGRVRVVR